MKHTSNRTDIDNVTLTTFGALLEDREDGLGHVDETRDIGVEHDFHVILVDFRGLGDALDQATVVYAQVSYLLATNV